MILTRRTLMIGLGVCLAPRLAKAAPVLEIADAWIRLGRPGQPPAAAYFQIINHGDADKLVEISTEAAGKVTLSKLTWKGLNPTVTPLPYLEIPEVHRVTLSPSGTAAVFENLTAPLRVGQRVTLTLRFEHGGSLDAEAKVSNQLLGNR